MITATKLANELRRKYPDPQAVLRRLGLDEMVAPSPSGSSVSSSSKEDDGSELLKFRFAIERVLSELGTRLHDAELQKFHDVLDRFAPTSAPGAAASDNEDKPNAGEEVSRRPPAMDSASLARFHAKYPDAARIVT